MKDYTHTFCKNIFFLTVRLSTFPWYHSDLKKPKRWTSQFLSRWRWHLISFSLREKHLSETVNVLFKILQQGRGGTLSLFYKQCFSFDTSFKLKTTYIQWPALFIVTNTGLTPHPKNYLHMWKIEKKLHFITNLAYKHNQICAKAWFSDLQTCISFFQLMWKLYNKDTANDFWWNLLYNLVFCFVLHICWKATDGHQKLSHVLCILFKY